MKSKLNFSDFMLYWCTEHLFECKELELIHSLLSSKREDVAETTRRYIREAMTYGYDKKIGKSLDKAMKKIEEDMKHG